MNNDPHNELLVAAAEQMKITELRLHKLLNGGRSPSTPQESAVAQVERRAGQIRAHVGASPTHCLHAVSQSAPSTCTYGSIGGACTKLRTLVLLHSPTVDHCTQKGHHDENSSHMLASVGCV